MGTKRETTAHGEGIYSRPINRTVNGRPIERYHGRVFVTEPMRLREALRYWGVSVRGRSGNGR